MKTYSRREWLNPDNVPADSSITAFHGDNSYRDTEGNVIENPETILRIKDCYKAVLQLWSAKKTTNKTSNHFQANNVYHWKDLL